ncbi:heparinase II/III family protein [Psychrosphaera sp. F3M07]|uniref:heparinase II/III family protein n=1 Tax=Psychrosphaera sp. F3M07 TaxID=2841560 RepID=UPI001C091DF6|nr:heparinase II/III family protein [Psychrosphaera sp. F3M07]MBU2917734.1 heparinase II/III family protein [Psychrosphaera sp. F3M07]
MKKFKHPKINTFTVVTAQLSGEWVTQYLHEPKFISDTDVCFLNHIGKVCNKAHWNNENEEKLWLYNLHYFDDLTAFNSDKRISLQIKWINKWIEDNPAAVGGNGWEPYTLSLRIVNWTKSFLSGLNYDQNMLNSLAQQADFLSQDLEKHLLGNHYFVNLKALFFAGCFLEGKNPDAWLNLAIKDFEKELNEQVLNDGGSFELTPMYHAILLTDLLDLANLFKCLPERVPSNIVSVVNKTIVKMFNWLDIMSLGDDKISFFNDSAFGIAPDNNVLRTYANKLGFSVDKLSEAKDKLAVYNLKDSGYVSVKGNNLQLIADLAEVGPSYIPGHAHADSLTFELSIDDQRVFVNSGTSLYGMSEERIRQRGTAAHNTVVINNTNSSEVWSGFRVARRANIIKRKVGDITEQQTVQFSASHNGYNKQGISCQHNRSWQVSLNDLEIKDKLEGEYQSAVAILHLHPDVDVVSYSVNDCLFKLSNYEINIKIAGASLLVEDATWHPEFGVVKASKKLKLNFLMPSVTYKITWKKL